MESDENVPLILRFSYVHLAFFPRNPGIGSFSSPWCCQCWCCSLLGRPLCSETCRTQPAPRNYKRFWQCLGVLGADQIGYQLIHIMGVSYNRGHPIVTMGFNTKMGIQDLNDLGVPPWFMSWFMMVYHDFYIVTFNFPMICFITMGYSADSWGYCWDILGILLGYSGEMIASNLAAWWFQGFGWVPTKGTQVTTVTAMVRGMFEATKQVTTHIEVHNVSYHIIFYFTIIYNIFFFFI